MDRPLTILVCGGRYFRDRERAWAALDLLASQTPLAAIVHGSARGADEIAGEWAAARGVACVACIAEWRIHGRSAGTLRNAAMLRQYKPHLVVAFPGGSGTADMVRRALSAKVPVWHPLAIPASAR